MSKLAHSDEASMKRIESDRLLEDDQIMFRCCNCGLACPQEIKSCDCITDVGFRKLGDQLEYVILKFN